MLVENFPASRTQGRSPEFHYHRQQSLDPTTVHRFGLRPLALLRSHLRACYFDTPDLLSTI